MDQIEIRIHEEINDYHEKFYWFTFRQWIAVILFGITAVPFYLKFRTMLFRLLVACGKEKAFAGVTVYADSNPDMI